MFVWQNDSDQCIVITNELAKLGAFIADQGQGTAGIGTQVPAQDYNKLRRSCIQNGKLFEDPYFPADDRSLFFSQKLPFTPEWKRPHVSDQSCMDQFVY